MRAQPSVPGQRAWVVFDVVSALAVTALTITQNLLTWHRHDWAASGYPVPTAGQMAFVIGGVLASGAALAAAAVRGRGARRLAGDAGGGLAAGDPRPAELRADRH